MYDIVILTDNRYINPKNIDWYTEQVLLEDKILQDSLENIGLVVCRKDWADKKFNWAHTKCAIFRSTWDYFERFEEFFAWIEETKNKIRFINATELIKWNINKRYLIELKNKGVNIASTLFINKDNQRTLDSLFKETNWNKAVIKPAISGAARQTYKITPATCKDYEVIFKQLISQESMLFQEFLNNIILKGEISVIMIAGKHTHAIIKTAKKGDFRVQDDHGGKVKKYLPSREEILFAEQCISIINPCPLYARVDIVYDNKNKLSLSELELIEPELWFRDNPKSAEFLAEEIKNYLTDSKDISNSISSSIALSPKSLK
tara:strand:+ start:7875 stop:8831 length:957 start_codon:yes stop_codon:yes gene_type:complete